MYKTVEEINRKILNRTVRVVTAEEMPAIVGELGAERAAVEVDVVTTGTFGAMCSSGVWLNFGHSEPPIKMTRAWLNDVELYAGVAAVDAYLGATQGSETLGMEYAGAHVIEDLLRGRPVVLRAVSYGTDCYPRKELVTEITLADLNQALMSNPRNAYQRYNAAANSGERPLHTYMGKLLPGCGNVTYSGAGELSPLANDPDYETIGIGTRIFLGGAVGTVTGAGTQHNPQAQFATLMVQGDLKEMSLEYLRAAVFHGYGSSLYVGIGIPIPVLHAGIARQTAIRDREIATAVVDFAIPSRSRPELGRCTYEQLKSGSVRLRGRDVPAAPLVSHRKSRQVALALKQWIERDGFTLSEPVAPIPRQGSFRALQQKPPEPRPALFYRRPTHAAPGADGRPRICDAGLCFSCGQCLGICPAGVFSRDAGWLVTADSSKCAGCGLCEGVCPVGAYLPARTAGGTAWVPTSRSLRTGRRSMEAKMSADLVQKRLRIKETFATVTAEEQFMELAARTIAAARADIESYIEEQPLFLSSLAPLPIDMAAPGIARRMAAAAALAGVGPMAAVAGAIAQVTVEALVAAGARHVIVDNGGDVVLRIDRPVKIGIFTGSALIRDIALRCEPRPGIFSVCTSSGTVGHSLSFGCADAATVIAANGCLADAAATALGNRVREKTEASIGAAIRESLLPEVEGVLVVAGKHMGLGGVLPPRIVRAPSDVSLISQG